MHKVHRQALVPHSSKKMFKLINDVSSYPEFLKWCVDAHVLESNDKEMLAGLTVKLAGLKQVFSTRNTFEEDAETKIIQLDLVEGPFEHLNGKWLITSLSENISKIELLMEFNFKSGFMNGAFRRGFSKIAERLISDFVERADYVKD